jgi:hypothetical protein
MLKSGQRGRSAAGFCRRHPSDIPRALGRRSPPDIVAASRAHRAVWSDRGSAGRFAAATVIVDHNALTVVFRADGKRWKVVSAERYCEDGAVPARIWQNACNSN